MISWFSNDIIFFALYAALGFASLAYLVHRTFLSRWGRFVVGLFSILYGTQGLLGGSQLLQSIKNTITVVPWNAAETYKLLYAASGIELASLVLQFAFAAVGAGLIVNAITVEKPLSSVPGVNSALNTDRTASRRRTG